MRYALVSDVPVSWATYEEVVRRALAAPPAGLVLHAAGPTDEGVRIIDVWENERAYRDFRVQRLLPLLEERASQPAITFFRDLRVRRLIVPRRAKALPSDRCGARLLDQPANYEKEESS